jgi:hypothetical protein
VTRAAGALVLFALVTPAVGPFLDGLREGPPASAGRVWVSAAGASSVDAGRSLATPARATVPVPAFAAHHFGAAPGHTGGFGEPSCDFCHFDRELNESGGTLALEGLPPEGYRPGERYELTLHLGHPELRLGGFQLTVRYAEGERKGEQAGTLIAGEGQDVTTPARTGIAYLGHRHDGTEPTAPGARTWVFHWEAPGASGKAEGGGHAGNGEAAGNVGADRLRAVHEGGGPAGPVVIHAAGNAADGDGSEFGDRIYTFERTLPKKDGPRGGT